MDQTYSVFMPGLTRRGPVYNSLEGLPTFSPLMKFGLIGVLFYLGMSNKIPMIVAAGGALAAWKFLPDTNTSPPITANLNPADLNAPPPPFDASGLTMPTVGIPLSGYEDKTPNFPGVPGYEPIARRY